MKPEPKAPLLMGAPRTKFLVPRLRRDVVGRATLLQRLRRLVDEHPLTLVCAPAGSGKTTLLAQLARAAAANEAVVWVSLDDSDDDPSHLLGTLVQSLQALDLRWETDPLALVGNVTGTGSEARAVLAGIVNALCTAAATRVLWVLDDLHRVASSACAGLLDALIERLPQHVALVLGSRTAPALPLARLRAHGDLGELGVTALRFDADMVVALARSRGDTLPDDARVTETLARTGGWAVGVNLMLAAGERPVRTAPSPAATPLALFDFFAEEVLAELPDDLARFAVECSVLVELDPLRCRAVTGRDDSRECLEALLRRHLFVDVIDEHGPVLRFHDLFRDFLSARLAQQPAAQWRRLHERIAAFEPLAERAIGHWLDAGNHRQAADLIIAHGLRIVADGGHAQVERWIERLAGAGLDGAEDDDIGSRLALLRAECAWVRWDWNHVASEARLAADGLRHPDRADEHRRATLLLAAALGAIGHLDERAELTERALSAALPDSDAAQFHLQRAWTAFSLGRCDAVAGHLDAMNTLVERDPALLAPAIVPTLNCHFGGLPGVTEAILRFVALCDTVPKPATLPWHSTPLVLGAWAALWQGQLNGVAPALARAEQIRRRYGKVRYVLLDANHLASLSLAAAGRYDEAVDIIDALLADLQSSDATGLRRAWLRPYRSVRARIAWMALDRDALQTQAGHMLGSLNAGEWPLSAAAAATVAGQAALLRGDLAEAEAILVEAAARHTRHPAPAFYADPRIALAACRLALGDREQAWQTAGPVFHELLRDRTPGRLLLEPRPRVLELLDTRPADHPLMPGLDDLQRQLAAAPERMATEPPVAGPVPVGHPHAGPAQPGSTQTVPEPIRDRRLAALTGRECEVLELVARGMPNKVLARQLQLSPHTVKRHLANILDKLDCDNRGQAAAAWRGEAQQ